MNIKVVQKRKRYFELNDQDNNQYRIFFKTSQNNTPSFSICIIHDVSPSKSISYKKTFLLDEFNQYTKNYKQYDNIDKIQNELMANILNRNIQISHIDNRTKLVNFLLNNNFKLSFTVFKVHEIIESNKLIAKTKEQIIETNNLMNKYGIMSNYLQKCEEVNKNNEIRLKNLKDITTKLFHLFNNQNQISNINNQNQIPNINNQNQIPNINNQTQIPNININNYPSEDLMLKKPKEERYRILGIKSDIVHTVKEILYISHWLSSEKVTKLDLLFKGPNSNFDATTFHSQFDNIVPCLILIETTTGSRFGGFTNKTWKGENEYKNDNTAFLFSLDFLEKYPINPQFIGTAILAKTQYLCGFGKGDLIIYDHCNKFLCKSDFPNTYICNNMQVNQRLRLTNYNHDFLVKDFEVFLVSFTTKKF